MHAENIANILERAQRMADAIEAADQINHPAGISAAVDILWQKWLSTFNTLCVLPSVDRDGQVSYSRKADDGDDRRVRTTLGRLVRRQWKIAQDEISDSALAFIAEKAALHIDRIPVDRISGDDIAECYRHDVVGSCMSRNPEYVQFYADNPERVSLLVHWNAAGQADARALLWNDIENEKLYLDREYGIGPHVQAIRDYAKSLGAIMRNEPGRRTAHWGETVTIRGFRLPSNNAMPYFDTLGHGTLGRDDKGRRTLTLSNSYGDIDFHNTGGGYLGDCPNCGEFGYYDNENGCDCCRGYCECCEETVNTDDLTQVYERAGARGNTRLVCPACLSSNYSYCVICEEYINNEETSTLDNGDSACHDHSYICDDCGSVTTEATDEYGHCADCAIVCQGCNEHFENANDIDSAGLCQNCACYCVDCGKPIDSSELCDECKANTLPGMPAAHNAEYGACATSSRDPKGFCPALARMEESTVNA